MSQSHTTHAGSGEPHVIHNPISGEKIIVRTSGAATNGELLVFDLFLPPGKQVPSRHVHPNLEETFTILQGEMCFRLGRKTFMARPGDTVIVPRGAAHWFGNRGNEEVVARVTARPALGMEEMFEATAAVQIGDSRSLLAWIRHLPALAEAVQAHGGKLLVSEGQAEPWEAATTPPDPNAAAMASCLPEHLITTYNQWLAPGALGGGRLFAYLFWGLNTGCSAG